MNRPLRTDTLPWYREPWPWLLMLGPLVVVVAGLYTAYLAVISNDGLVADDYYKQGLEVNQQSMRDRRAAELGIEAQLVVNGNGDRLRVYLRADPTTSLPNELILRLNHPTQPGLDQRVTLTADGGGVFSGRLTPFSGRRHLIIEDTQKQWRLLGDWEPDKSSPPRLVARAAETPMTGRGSVDGER
ncbi:MAG TPA: FixH family protein [Accumulibacter sp.]|nr:FixH family protein [Accumulibacter sp.]HMW16359.1 FixH family protein [Accumulibacter sp.]HMX22226.1 FixH family protein [Accumulibacter sp.]HMY06352.1 FixH family protein [Accumulibacter sp.]HNC17370.1 FixH family protein [Accumulibacter sp.]